MGEVARMLQDVPLSEKIRPTLWEAWQAADAAQRKEIEVLKRKVSLVEESLTDDEGVTLKVGARAGGWGGGVQRVGGVGRVGGAGRRA